MPGVTNAPRLALALALVPAFTLSAAGGGSTLPVQQREHLQTVSAEASMCPTIGTGDTAGAIDCEVNQALTARRTVPAQGHPGETGSR